MNPDSMFAFGKIAMKALKNCPQNFFSKDKQKNSSLTTIHLLLLSSSAIALKEAAQGG